MKKEVKAVHLLDELLRRCEPEEIDKIFMLQIVYKEERALLQQIADYNGNDYDLLYTHYNQIDIANLDSFAQSFESAIKNKDDSSNTVALQNLQAVRERREVLEAGVKFQSKQKLLDLMEFVGEDQVQILGEQKSIDDAIKFLGVSKDEYRDLIAFHDNSGYNSSVIECLKLEQN